MKQDLQRLAQQAYHRSQWSSGLVRRYHREKASIPAALADRVEHLYRWFFAPMTLWPFNIQGFLERVLDAIKSRRKLDAATELLFHVLPPVPDENTVDAVTAHEHDVQSGRYEHLVPASVAKFAASERALSKSKAFQADWKRVTDCFNVTRHADHKGVIRRTMGPLRGLSSLHSPIGIPHQDILDDPNAEFQTHSDAERSKAENPLAFIVARWLHCAGGHCSQDRSVFLLKTMKTKLSRFDAAEHLRSPEEMSAYLMACMEEAGDDAAFVAKALGDIARVKGMSQIAKASGLSRESLYKALSGERVPAFDTVLKVCHALGIQFTPSPIPQSGH